MTTPRDADFAALRDQARYTIDELEALLAAAARLPEGIAEAEPPSGEPSVADLLRGLARRDESRADAVVRGKAADSEAAQPEAAQPDPAGVDPAGAVHAAPNVAPGTSDVESAGSFNEVVALLIGARQRLLQATEPEQAGEAGRRALEQAIQDDRETLRSVAYRLHEAGVGR